MKMKRWFKRIILGLLAVFLMAIGILALINRSLPEQSATVETLSAAEKARLAEFTRLRQQIGGKVWPGWDAAEIPLVVYNEAYAFMVGSPQPAAGWTKVPQNIHHGQTWALVPDDLFDGDPYFRQPLPASGATPEAFTVKVGNQWAASMPTMEWMQISLINQFRSELPAFLVPIFPYTMLADLFLRGSDGYISLWAHESFHAFQGMLAPERLAAAETAVSLAKTSYPWADLSLQANWQNELDLLTTAVQVETKAEAAELARQFLAQRALRRQEANLNSALIDYERQREWLEGVARYVELEIWRQASLAAAYEPTASLASDPDFAGYTTFSKRWSQEIDQIGRMADDTGDGRFYYSGMAQAVLLDWLLPDWKMQALDEGVFLEDLLETAVALP